MISKEAKQKFETLEEKTQRPWRKAVNSIAGCAADPVNSVATLWVRRDDRVKMPKHKSLAACDGSRGVIHCALSLYCACCSAAEASALASLGLYPMIGTCAGSVASDGGQASGP